MNIVLIGMPGVGKSTIGIVLAKVLAKDFMDTDLEIQKNKACSLQEIIDSYGNEYFREVENKVLSEIHVENTVIATGGSAVFGEDAMKNLQKNAVVVYLKLSATALKERLSNLATRGISMKKGQTIESLCEERRPYYEKYAQITIDCEGNTLEESVEVIKNKLENFLKK